MKTIIIHSFASQAINIQSIFDFENINERLTILDFINAIDNNKSQIVSINKKRIDRETNILINVDLGIVEFISNKRMYSRQLINSEIELKADRLDFTNQSNQFTKAVSAYKSLSITNMLFEGIDSFNQRFGFESYGVQLTAFDGKADIKYKGSVLNSRMSSVSNTKQIFLNTLKKEIKL